MYQEIEGQKPVIISRNHNARVRTPVYRWNTPPDWNPVWNFQRAELTGLCFGITKAIYQQMYEPATDLLRYYQAPDNLGQLRIFTREVMKMENFRSGFLSNLMFYSTYGLTFQTARFYFWKDYAGGFAHDKHCTDVNWIKKLLTAAAAGVVTCWIPVPFHNVHIRLQQDRILPKELARGYKNHLHAALSILKNDGIFPFFRSGGPLMAEACAETFALFYWTDFFKDKCRPLKNWGTDHPGNPENFLRFMYVSLGTYCALITSYPFRTLRYYVEELPKNAKGELYFKNYAEAFWKGMGDTFSITHLWNGFHRYVGKAGLPLFATLWFADSIGMFEQVEFPQVYVPAE